MITVTRNAAGDVVNGDPNKIREVTDVWTFERDVQSKDPNWTLVATEAPR
jgi:predicted lipid-binding transport protein (Tim44 family)